MREGVRLTGCLQSVQYGECRYDCLPEPQCKPGQVKYCAISKDKYVTYGKFETAPGLSVAIGRLADSIAGKDKKECEDDGNNTCFCAYPPDAGNTCKNKWVY